MNQHKLSPQQKAKLRVCASCEWIFKGTEGCPQCGFVSYGARHVYGNRAYRYAQTQKPWKNNQMIMYEMKLNNIIRETQPVKNPLTLLVVQR